MNGFSKLALAAALSASLTGAANASIIWNFSYTQGAGSLAQISGSGTMMTSEIGAPYALESISGIRTSSDSSPSSTNITGLSPYAAADNLLNGSAPLVSFSGISFTTDSGVSFNLYKDSTGYFELRSDINPGGFPDGKYPINLEVTFSHRVPEPASIAIFAIALMSLFGFAAMRRRA